MDTNIDYDTLDRSAQLALQSAAAMAAANLAAGGGDDLVVLRNACPLIPGEQNDDDVRAVASIDIIRALVADYESEQVMTAITRVERWLNALDLVAMPSLDVRLPGGVIVKEPREALREVLKAAKISDAKLDVPIEATRPKPKPEPGLDSYSLRDRDGDWWVYVHDYMSWLPLGQGISSHTGILGLEEGAAKIIAHHGVWA